MLFNYTCPVHILWRSPLIVDLLVFSALGYSRSGLLYEAELTSTGGGPFSAITVPPPVASANATGQASSSVTGIEDMVKVQASSPRDG